MITIQVYMDFGMVFQYVVSDVSKAREHAAAIIANGYRHTPEGSDDLELFLPHRILKVKIIGGGESNYKDVARAT